MKLSEMLRLECVRAGSSSDDKSLVLCEIAALARQSPICRNISEDTILEAFQERETLGATAFGNGIAIPHCRMRGVSDFVVGLMTFSQGVDFEAADGKKVRLLVFIIAPREESNTHIRLLSALSRMLQDSRTVKRLLGARSNGKLAEAFIKAAGGDIETIEPTARSLVHIFVQDEKTFRSLLEAVASLEGISLSVFDAANARSYLVHLPLYVEFAHNGEVPACKVIVALVERQLSNEVIRRVESVTGSLYECTGVMVTVQEPAYSAGALEM